MQTVCTIITANYLPLAKVLHTSLQRHVPGTSLQVLVVDKNNFTSTDGLTIYSFDTISNSPIALQIEKKYAPTNADHFRWALKPVFISYLLQNGFDKVIFADPDLYFVNNFNFLFDELDSNNILLTPHWANINPLEKESGLIDVLSGGLYNAGFVGANKKGAEAINWWAAMCHYKMDRQKELGIYDDQKYLDILPVQFSGVKVLKHQGCNLASWNIDTCKREMINGRLLINEQFEPIFIHFARETIANIINRNDKLLQPYLEEYIQLLKNENFDPLTDFTDHTLSKYSTRSYKLKHQLRLRTRLKTFLFKLAGKL